MTHEKKMDSLLFAGMVILTVTVMSAAAFSAPFSWQRDELFRSLEKEYLAASRKDLVSVERDFSLLEDEGISLLSDIAGSGKTNLLPLLSKMETIQFRMAAIAATHETMLVKLQGFISRARKEIKRAGAGMPQDSGAVNDAVYRVLYGGRAAVEEAWIQNRNQSLPAILQSEMVRSETPSVPVEGVRVHSGDVLLSRGGAPTSALIARGNDYPGVFSHVALVYVDPDKNVPVVIEALIEKGVVLTTLEEYLHDKKRRILLLRLRPDHPALLNDPLAPHKAAAAMYARAAAGHLPYDFALDWNDDGKMFCSEVAYHAYRKVGIELWKRRTTLTSPGVRAWLSDLGVLNFTTILPSDLEYDPDLVAVVEWRDPDVLKDDRIDNAMMDALLEDAERGTRLGYRSFQPVFFGLAKAWSQVQSLLGFKRSIPEGMSIGAALRVNGLLKTVAVEMRSGIRRKIAAEREKSGYEPPYWVLLELSRETLNEHREEFSPILYTASVGSAH